MDHVCELVKRSAQHIKEEKRGDDLLCCQIQNYESDWEGQLGFDNTQSKRLLSTFVYTNLYLHISKHALYLTSETQTDGSVKV